MRSFVAYLLLLGIGVAYGASVMSYGPIIPSVGCDEFAVVSPNPNLAPSTPDTYYYVYGTDASYGFSSGELYTNSPSQFMNQADGKGFLYWKIQDGSPSQWSPSMGTLYVVIDLYSNAARTSVIGHGNLTSTDFFAHNYTDNLSPHGWVIAVGGNVTLSYDIIPSATQSPAPGFSTTVFQSRTENLYFPPNRNMWDNKETFTNRFFSRADAATFSAPLFDTAAHSKTFWNSGTYLAPYTANYDNVIQLWGSNGFNFATGSYTTPNIGIDVALGLTCTGGPPSIHVVPPPCPRVPPCAGCSTQATVSGVCASGATATTQAGCLTFTVDDSVACTAATSSVQV